MDCWSFFNRYHIGSLTKIGGVTETVSVEQIPTTVALWLIYAVVERKRQRTISRLLLSVDAAASDVWRPSQKASERRTSRHVASPPDGCKQTLLLPTDRLLRNRRQNHQADGHRCLKPIETMDYWFVLISNKQLSVFSLDLAVLLYPVGLI